VRIETFEKLITVGAADSLQFQNPPTQNPKPLEAINRMNKGILYKIFDWLIESLNYINLVEILKRFISSFFKGNKISVSRATVDFYIFSKWVIISMLWFFEVKNEWVNYFVWYLIATNLLSYFYHHTWTKSLQENTFDLDRLKRRYLNLLLAIGFNILCFAYLFAVPFASNFTWEKGYPNLPDALFFSTANLLITDYKLVNEPSYIGSQLALIEMITTFIFLTIILSNSIPQHKEKN
jgi:hypothetical protein